MAQVEKKQIKKIHVLLAKLHRANDKEYKAMLVGQYSDGRETSTTQLTYAEAGALIDDLQGGDQACYDRMMGDAANKKRRLLLHYAHEMMWYCQAGTYGDKPVLDMARIDGWCINYGQHHKALNEHTSTEMSDILVQFEKAFRSFLKSV